MAIDWRRSEFVTRNMIPAQLQELIYCLRATTEFDWNFIYLVRYWRDLFAWQLICVPKDVIAKKLLPFGLGYTTSKEHIGKTEEFRIFCN